MAAYLQRLSARLAVGAANAPAASRAAVAEALRRAQNDDGGFSGREGGSDLYYTSFALRTLAIVGGLDESLASRAGQYLRNHLASQAALIDLLSLLYSAAILRQLAPVDPLAAAPPEWPTAVAAALEQFRRPDGGYARSEEGQASSTYYTFLVVLALELIERPVPDPEGIIRLVAARRRDDGGYVEVGPMRTSGTNPTAAAIGLLTIVDRLDDNIRRETTAFLARMQTPEGGLAANTRIGWADLLSTFTGLLTLDDLGGLDQVDIAAIDRYAESLALPDGRYRSSAPDPGSDVEYTFYGWGTRSLVAAASG